MATFGYVRISTQKQNEERQIRNIKLAYPEATIVKEIYTGTTFQGRKELDKLIRIIKPGDCIVFDSVSRMSRDAKEGCRLYEELFCKNISLIFLKEPHINTDVYRTAIQKQIDVYVTTGNVATDKFIKHIMKALNQFVIDLAKGQILLAFQQAEKEVQDLRQRTKEGIQTARLNGKQIGQQSGRKLSVQKAITAKTIILKHSKDFNGALNDLEMMKLTGLARNTYYKYKRELKDAEYRI